LKGFFIIQNTTFVVCLFHTLAYGLNVCKIAFHLFDDLCTNFSQNNIYILWNYTTNVTGCLFMVWYTGPLDNLSSLWKIKVMCVFNEFYFLTEAQINIIISVSDA